MDKHYLYLVINFLTVFFPVILSFDSRVKFSKNWKYIAPGLLITGLVFLVWDYVFTVLNVWSFNPDYITGVYFIDLPVEEILFFITVPFACIFIYECLNYYVAKSLSERLSKWISNILIILSLVLICLFYNKAYTLITFSLMLLVVFYAQYIKRAEYMGRFYLAYLVSLLPFYMVNGLLTSIPVVMYNNTENMSLRIGSIPFEDHFYSLTMLLMNIIFYEHFRKKPI